MREHYVFGRQLKGELTAEAVRAILLEARARRARLEAVPLERILSLLDRAARLWANPEYAGRQEVMRRIPDQIGFSSEMVTLELESLKKALSRSYLEPKIRTELGSLEALDIWQGGNGQAFKRAVPRGVVLHVSSGNVFTGGILSMIEGMLTKNVNILKAASKAPLFPLLFARSLQEVDAEGILSQSLAILSWSGEKSSLHREFQQHCDAIVVWGGEGVVKEYREGLALKTRLIEYGPKVSFGLIARERLEDPAVAKQAATAISLWDQNACSSPQVLYLEASSLESHEAVRFRELLVASLKQVQCELPQGKLSLQERAEVTKEREMARFAAAMGTGELVTPGNDPSWTVILENDPELKLSCLMRTIYLKPIVDLEDLPGHLRAFEDHLQTAGIAAPPERLFSLARQLNAAGVLRVTTLDQMSGGTPGEPHDGLMALQELIKWVSLGFPEAPARFDGAEWLSEEELSALSFGKRQRLVEESALRAPYHRDRLQGLRLQGPHEWEIVPIMERTDIAAHTPPEGIELFTSEPNGGHFLRSGGTTASPKLSVFSYADYEADMFRAARGAYAVGLRRGDRVANMFFSGGLYGSFLSVNRAIEIVGGNNFPFASTVAAAEMPYFLRSYGIDTLMGLPSWLLKVFDAIKAAPEGIRIRKVFYTGEPLYASEQAYLREAFDLEIISSIGYGTVDAGPIGFQCPHSAYGIHHVHADHQYVEIVDPVSLRPLGPGEIGEVLVTNLNRDLMPLIRYRIGDLGRWIEEPCRCGRAMPRFDLLGRSDDVLLLAGLRLHYADFQRVASAIAGLNSMIQLVAEGSAPREALRVRAELVGANDALDLAELASALKQGILARIPGLRDHWEQGLMSQLEIDVLPAGGLERLERTGKIKRLIDQRREA